MGVKYDNMKQTDQRCNRCSTKVLEEVVPELKKDYQYYCPTCDENMMTFEVSKDKMRRDTWIVINQVINTVMNLNALFCEKPDMADGQICEQREIDTIARDIAEGCAGTMPLEDMKLIIDTAYAIQQDEKGAE